MTTNAEYDYVLAVLKAIRPMLDRMVLPMRPSPVSIGEVSSLSLDGIEHLVRHHAIMAGWRPIEMRNDPIVLSRDELLAEARRRLEAARRPIDMPDVLAEIDKHYGHRVADELRGITTVDPETFEELNRP